MRRWKTVHNNARRTEQRQLAQADAALTPIGKEKARS